MGFMAHMLIMTAKNALKNVKPVLKKQVSSVTVVTKVLRIVILEKDVNLLTKRVLTH